MIIGFDTNVLAYLAGVDHVPADAPKIAAIKAMMPQLAHQERLVAPIQAMCELYNVVQRGGGTRVAARDIVLRMKSMFDTADSSSATLMAALDLAVDHRLLIWDALILSAVAEAGCTMLLTEDMHAGFVWRSVTVVNPFAETLDPRFRALLA